MTVDVMFGRAKVAVFVDGCFWHSCPKHGHVPRPGPNSNAWAAKFARVREREAEARQIVESRGYEVVRVWECDVRAAPDHIALEIEKLVVRRRSHCR
jgi:DNA mismatch endonuclease (patch repair protein)